jgi:hypothetical protein
LYRSLVEGLAIMKWQLSSLPLVLALFVLVLSVTPVFSQSKNRILHWSEPVSIINTPGSGYSEVLAQIEAFEIVDVTVGSKSITIGEVFSADDLWLKTLTFKVKNVSNLSFSIAQLTLFLPEIMPGGPLVTLCYGDAFGKVKNIAPGEEVEMKVAFYNWLTDQINAKSDLSKITETEIQQLIVTRSDGQKWISRCVKTASAKNSCPKPAP